MWHCVCVVLCFFVLLGVGLVGFFFCLFLLFWFCFVFLPDIFKMQFQVIVTE